MAIDVREVKTRRDLRAFIYLPEKIHKNHRNWVPPIYLDDRKYFNPQKNKADLSGQPYLLLRRLLATRLDRYSTHGA